MTSCPDRTHSSASVPPIFPVPMMPMRIELSGFVALRLLVAKASMASSTPEARRNVPDDCGRVMSCSFFVHHTHSPHSDPILRGQIQSLSRLHVKRRVP